MTPTAGDAKLSVITANWDTGSGYGLLEGYNVSGPVVWMYGYPGNNAFTVAKKIYNGSGADITNIDSYMSPLFQVRES